jgi:hypothetical protein
MSTGAFFYVAVDHRVTVSCHILFAATHLSKCHPMPSNANAGIGDAFTRPRIDILLMLKRMATRDFRYICVLFERILWWRDQQIHKRQIQRGTKPFRHVLTSVTNISYNRFRSTPTSIPPRMTRPPRFAHFTAFHATGLNGCEPPAAPMLVRLLYYRWLVVGTVCIGAFMGQVDSSIAQLLLPRLEYDFGARLSTVSWVAVAYLITMAAFLPIFGRIADIVGRKLLYTGGFLLFVLGSGLCGLAPNLPMLISFRVIQAIGAALLASNSVAIVVTVAGPEQRGRALGIQAAAQAVGLSLGPMIGGLVLATLNWRWVFWINVPFGLAASVIGWFVIPPTADISGKWRFDWKGAVLIMPALAAFIALINEAHVWGVTSPIFLGGGLVTTVFMFLFLCQERGNAEPLIEFFTVSNQRLLGRQRGGADVLC